MTSLTFMTLEMTLKPNFEIASTHILLLTIWMIDLTWMPPINRQRRPKSRISHWLVNYWTSVKRMNLQTDKIEFKLNEIKWN